MRTGRDIVIVTGSSGYIGRALTESLSTHYSVIGLDVGLPKYELPGVDYRTLDFSSPNGIDQTLREISEEYGKRIRSVVHLVAYYSFSGKASSLYDEITVEGTRHFLLSLEKYFDVGQFIFSSTMLVFAPTSLDEEISEESTVQPGWPYPQSKVKAEEAIQENHGKMKVVILRLAGVYDDYGHCLPIGQQTVRIFERQLTSHFFPGNVNHGQSYLHLDDLTEAVSLLIERGTLLPETLTLVLGEDEVLSYQELQERLGTLIHGTPWSTLRVPEWFAKWGAAIQERLPLVREPFVKPWMIEFADDHYKLDLTRLRKHLGWEPRHRLREALPKMVQALKKNPDQWYQEHKIEKPRYRRLKSSPSVEGAHRTAALANVFFALWLLSSPFMASGMSKSEFWNDILLAPFIIIVSLLSFIPTIRWVRWINAMAATWLMFSPLVFWTQRPVVYSTSTMLSVLILIASAYTPPSHPEEKSEVPRGWSYNPSAWNQRVPIMFLSFAGFLFAKYLAAYQLGHITEVWDPFFGQGTEKILTSSVSQTFPISDAGLGALSYLIDVAATVIGDKNRWRTMPWMVILFGLFIIPTGVTSITLIMLQPIAVNAWCFLCIVTAFIMLIMVPPSIDEVSASIQYLRRSVKEGKPFWNIFWFGGDYVETVPEPAEAKEGGFPFHFLLSALLGIWLMVTPYVFQLEEGMANHDFILGALVTTFSVVAFSPIARPVRFINVALGCWLILLGWTSEISGLSLLNSQVAGLLLMALSLPRGQIMEHFGALDSWARWTPMDLLRQFQGPKKS